MTPPKSIYGIIGLPLSHSLSPVMHNAAFKALKMNAEYKTFPLQELELEKFFYELKKKSCPIHGLNVTVPYKESIIPLLDTISPYAKKVMAINTITISEDRMLTGFNTDGAGFLTHLTELGFDATGKRIAILGAGGTTRAILTVLCMIPERPHSIRIYNRNFDRAKQLIADLKERMDTSLVEVVASIDDLNIELADLLINTTAVGLNEDDPSLVDESLLHRDLLVYDVIYNPPTTKLLQMAQAQGAKVSNGLGMLFYQGVLAFQHWMGFELDQKIKTKMRQALLPRFKNS